MKNKMVKYMINREINPIEFADLVNLRDTTSAKKESEIIGQKEKGSVSIFDVLLVFAVILVAVFLVAIFL